MAGMGRCNGTAMGHDFNGSNRMTLTAILLTGCLHWVELVQTLNHYAPVQIQQVILGARRLPPADRARVMRAIELVRRAQARGKDPAKVAAGECGLKQA